MDAIVGNMRSTFGNGVRRMKMFTVPLQNSSSQDINTNKVFSMQAPRDENSKYFGISLNTICQREQGNIPFLVKDICSYISNNAVTTEGIFRISAPQKQVTRLKELYESNSNYISGLLVSIADIEPHAAAGLLKNFFRQLPEPLIMNNVISVFEQSKALSDTEFAIKVSEALQEHTLAHQQTLKYLLEFLRVVMRTPENRMSATGLSVVFGPNMFDTSKFDNVILAQSLANDTFHRLLSCSEALTFSVPDSLTPRPRRPPPPIPTHKISPRSESTKPQTPIRSTSLTNNTTKYSPIKENGHVITTSIAPNVVASSVESAYSSDTSLSHMVSLNSDITSRENSILEDSISRIVKKRLFSDSESSTEDGCHSNVSLLSPVTAGRVSGPKNRRKPSAGERRQKLLNNVSFEIDSDEELSPKHTKSPIAKPRKSIKKEAIITVQNVATNQALPPSRHDFDNGIKSNLLLNQSSNNNPASSSTVMTPDSGCITEEHDPAPPRTSSPVRNNNNNYTYDDQTEAKKVFIPKLNLRNSYDEDMDRKLKKSEPVTKEVVPPLDLSDVTDGDSKPHVKVRKSPGGKIDKDTSPNVSRRHPRKLRAKSSPPSRKMKPNVEKIITVEKRLLSPATVEEYQLHMLANLEESRNKDNRPYELSELTFAQVCEEKLVIQRELLKYESKFGRPVDKSVRDLMREIYDRYRSVKKLAKQKQDYFVETHMIDGNTAELSNSQNNDIFLVTKVLPDRETQDQNTKQEFDQKNAEICELRNRQHKIHKILREFETTARADGKKPEKAIMRKEYEQYRQIKAKLKELEEIAKLRH